jgi:ABC-type phosphate transport system substrate-binding protein
LAHQLLYALATVPRQSSLTSLGANSGISNLSAEQVGGLFSGRITNWKAIDGGSPIDDVYPYYQLFYYVTRGVPSGAVQKFIDFNFSAQGKALLEKHGMIALEKE